MKYETPNMKVIKLDVTDIIQTSLGENELPGLPLSLTPENVESYSELDNSF
ncbi:MAG: hypothetical protein IJY55_02890 [Clostridia bacterium]|nr:hypothetical protein [Clostridia bacterium]